MAADVIAQARQAGRTQLTEIEAKELIRAAGIPTTAIRLATTRKEAVERSREIGFPVVLKVVSPDVVHKSDVGGVKVGLNSAAAVERAFGDIMASVKLHQPQAKVMGVSVQTMARPGLEVIVGTSKDAQFGPVIMFGLGGILVEVLKDVSFRIVPIERRDARQMIHELKGFPLLQGYRGQEPANIPMLEDLLLKVSAFVDQRPEIKEMDLNPVFAYKDGLVAVDARVVLES